MHTPPNQRLLRKLLRHDDLDGNIQDDEDHSALIWTAGHGQQDVVRTLLWVRSIDPSIQSKEGFTALICAAGQGYMEIQGILENRFYPIQID